MARTPKQAPVLTKAEIKVAKDGLKAALKVVNDEHGKYVSDDKAARKTLDALTKDQAKAMSALLKEQSKAVEAQRKLVETTSKKLEKATVAADKGRAKIAAELAKLEPVKAETPETETETAA